MADLSAKYANAHGAYIYFSGKGKTVKLKAFLSDFSVNVAVDRTSPYDSDRTTDINVYKDKGVKYSYSFSINLPFNSLAEAKAGKRKIDNLVYMFAPDADTRRDQPVARGVTVLFSNLINNGQGATSLDDHGIDCVTDSLGVEYNSDFGFFDKNKQFYSKLYTLSFTLRAKPISTGNKKIICRGFEDNGEYDIQDVKYWPFWVELETGMSNEGMNEYEQQYADGHNAYIYISHSSEGDRFVTRPEDQSPRKVKFVGFLDNFSKKHSYEYAEKDIGSGISVPMPKQIKEVGYNLTIQVPANTQQQARRNMAKAQLLLRIIAPQANENDPSSPTTVKFANLINNSFYLNAVNIKVDVDLGFFEKWGFYYFKNYTLDLDLIQIDKELDPDAEEEEEEEEEEAPEEKYDEELFIFGVDEPMEEEVEEEEVISLDTPEGAGMLSEEHIFELNGLEGDRAPLDED